MGNRLTKRNKASVSKTENVLTNETQASNINRVKLTSDKRSSVKFRLAIDHKLEDRYSFKRLNAEGIKAFSKFLVNTVGKDLTITQTEQLFLRTKGTVKEETKINNTEREIIHFGKNRDKFRIFGYYDNDYFVVHRIDPKHDYHKS